MFYYTFVEGVEYNSRMDCTQREDEGVSHPQNGSSVGPDFKAGPRLLNTDRHAAGTNSNWSTCFGVDGVNAKDTYGVCWREPLGML